MTPLKEKFLKAIDKNTSNGILNDFKMKVAAKASAQICIEEISIELSKLLDIKYLTKDDVIKRIAELQSELKTLTNKK